MANIIDLPEEAYEHLSLLEFARDSNVKAMQSINDHSVWLWSAIGKTGMGRLPDGRIIRRSEQSLILPSRPGAESEATKVGTEPS